MLLDKYEVVLNDSGDSKNGEENRFERLMGWIPWDSLIDWIERMTE